MLQENARGDRLPHELFRTGNQNSVLFQNDSRDSGLLPILDSSRLRKR
jgi:hypothetical protein